jgi:hypothetical protein
MEWLVPICLFWTLAALYLGGWPVEIVGGSGVRQVIGLINTFLLFIIVFAGLRAVLGGLGGLVWGVVLPIGLTSLALPAIAWAGYIVVGVRVQKGEVPH